MCQVWGGIHVGRDQRAAAQTLVKEEEEAWNQLSKKDRRKNCLALVQRVHRKSLSAASAQARTQAKTQAQADCAPSETTTHQYALEGRRAQAARRRQVSLCGEITAGLGRQASARNQASAHRK